MPWVMGLSPDEIGQSKEAMSNNGASFFTRNDVVHAVPATSDIKRNHAGGFDIHFKAADSGKEGTFFTLRDGGDDVAAIVPGSQCVMLASSAAGGDSSKRKSEDRRSAAEAEQGYSHGDDMVSHCSVVTIDCLPLPAPRSVVTLNAVTSISLSPDCSRLAIANDKTELVLIDTTNGKPIYDIDFGHEKEYMAVRCMAVQFPSDARALLVAGIAENPDQSQIGLDVNIVDADTGEIFGSLPVCGDRGADPEYDVLDVRKGACFLRTKDATGGWFSFTPVEKIDPLFPASSQASSSALLLGDFFSLREPFTHGEAGLPEFSSVEDLRENLRGLIEFQHEAGSDSEEKRWISWLLSDPGDRPPTPASTRK
jgi:hypothetical protein